MPLIELRDITKTYHVGEIDLPVLKAVSLTIERGELVALMGSSGSGKTTLMNLLGCLDRPTSGSYRLDGIDVTRLSRTQLATLRGSRIGFVFQSFNLLARMSAYDNVRMPAGYSPGKRTNRQLRRLSRDLLETVGLKERLDHSPAQLSGGEQQRVAIARSLINEPALLLADEPTGNLDSHTGDEILQLFRQLNQERNITLLLVTHDPDVARHADRVIRISDGQIVEDPREESVDVPSSTQVDADASSEPVAPFIERRRSNAPRIVAGSVRIALQALRRNVMRTVLTMLGIIIGVAAVIAMMEISQGASDAIEITVSNMGANTLLVIPAPLRRGAAQGNAQSLTAADAQAIARECPNVVCAAPVVRARAQVVHGNRNWIPIYLLGSTPDFLIARNWTDMEFGRAFNEREVRSGAKVCLIGQTLARELFGQQYPIGQEVRVKNEPFKVVGVLREKGANLLGVDQDDILVAPWTTIKYRISGQGSTRYTVAARQSPRYPGKGLTSRLPGRDRHVRSESLSQILVKAETPVAMVAATEEVTQVLRDRHGTVAGGDDFVVRDMAEVSNALENTIRLLSGLALSVATVSLIVGGVGIMNIMLVSVTERTREIGLRMAVGANAKDIWRQFIVESVVLCIVGGLIGILTGRGASLLVGLIMAWPTRASVAAAIVAVVVSATVGVTFGYYPAWKASRLNPIDALRYE